MSVITYKCPNCGAPLKFDADGQDWKCEFCLSSFQEEQIKVIEDKLPIEDEYASKARVYSCSSCGAEIMTDDTTAATFCYYCHNPAIIPKQLSGDYKPAKVIPFQFDREKATDIFIKWCKKKPLVSRDFIKNTQLKLLSGVYIPFWLFDCDINGNIAANARKIRTWTSGNKRYTETKHYHVSRNASARFEGVPADGSQKTDDRLMETLEPFDYSKMEDFSMSYLSGYLAERYDQDEKQVYGRIRSRIEDYTSKLLHDTIQGYSSVSVNSCNVDIQNAKATYVLLPTWMLTYHYNGKTYVFAMNGQTGKIAGSLPISKARAAAWFGGISASVFAILLIGGLLL